MDVIDAKRKGDAQMTLDATQFSKINVDQFFGIEIDPLAAEIARVGMWLCDHQCNMALSQRFGMCIVRLPLKTSENKSPSNSCRIRLKTMLPKCLLISS